MTHEWEWSQAERAKKEPKARAICHHLGLNPDVMVMRGVPCKVSHAPENTFFQLPVFPLWESFVDYVPDEETS